MPAQGTPIVLPIAGLHAVQIVGFGVAYVSENWAGSLTVTANNGTTTTGGTITFAPATP